MAILKSFFRFSLGLIRLNRTIRYHGEQKVLIDMLDQLAKGNTFGQELVCRKIADQHYMFGYSESEPFRWGVGYGGLRIQFEEEVKVEVHLLQQSERLHLLQCSGKIRRMHLCIFAFYSLIAGGELFSKDGISFGGWLLLTVLFTIIHVIANNFWSRKEQYVIGEIKDAIRIQMKLNQ